MEPAVLALVGLTLTVVGLTLTVMIHLDRSRGKAMQNGFDRLAGALNQLRADMTENDDKLRAETTGALNQLRADMTENDDKLRAETTGALNQLRADMTENDDKLRAEMQAGFAANAAALLELARNVGRVEGRTETLVTSQ